jgi:pimeloyl-ACP methyl ester carboxylesterase
MIRRAPERIAGFAALLGAPGRPFRTGLPDPAGPAAEAGFVLARRFPWLAQAPLALAVALPEIARKALAAISFIDPGADAVVFARNVRGVRDAEKRAYLRTILALAAHDASDLLPRVRCPTVVIAGTRDWLTPPPQARRMAEAIPGAAYREIPGGSHFGLIEKAPSVNAWIGELLARAFGGA